MNAYCVIECSQLCDRENHVNKQMSFVDRGKTKKVKWRTELKRTS